MNDRVRNKGAGSAILEKIKTRATTTKPIILEATSTAVNFYKKLGFQKDSSQAVKCRNTVFMKYAPSKVRVGGNDSDIKEESDGYDSDTLVNTLVGDSEPISIADVVRNVATSIRDFFTRMTNTDNQNLTLESIFLQHTA